MLLIQITTIAIHIVDSTNIVGIPSTHGQPLLKKRPTHGLLQTLDHILPLIRGQTANRQIQNLPHHLSTPLPHNLPHQNPYLLIGQMLLHHGQTLRLLLFEMHFKVLDQGIGLLLQCNNDLLDDEEGGGVGIGVVVSEGTVEAS